MTNAESPQIERSAEASEVEPAHNAALVDGCAEGVRSEEARVAETGAAAVERDHPAGVGRHADGLEGNRDREVVATVATPVTATHERAEVLGGAHPTNGEDRGAAHGEATGAREPTADV